MDDVVFYGSELSSQIGLHHGVIIDIPASAPGGTVLLIEAQTEFFVLFLSTKEKICIF